MKKVHFFADDFYLLQAFKHYYFNIAETTKFISSVKDFKLIDSLTTKNDNRSNIFVFSFSNIKSLEHLKSINGVDEMNVIVIIDTPMQVDFIKVGNWKIVSKYANFESINNALDFSENNNIIFFTKRERQVSSLLINGFSYRVISSKLKLSPKTVYSFASKAICKTKMERKSELNFLRYMKVFI